jgi:hypothetical protein
MFRMPNDADFFPATDQIDMLFSSNDLEVQYTQRAKTDQQCPFEIQVFGDNNVRASFHAISRMISNKQTESRDEGLFFSSEHGTTDLS